jgi:hypothetical protein
MGDVVEFKQKEKKDYGYSYNVSYSYDTFTMEWENLGLSYHGTLQSNYIVDKLENLVTVDKSKYNKVVDYVEETLE